MTLPWTGYTELLASGISSPRENRLMENKNSQKRMNDLFGESEGNYSGCVRMLINSLPKLDLIFKKSKTRMT